MERNNEKNQEVVSDNIDGIKKNNKKVIFIVVLFVIMVATIIAVMSKEKIIKAKDDNKSIGYISQLSQDEIILLEKDNSSIVSDELIVTFKENVSNKDAKKIIEKYEGKIVGEIYFLNQYQVKFEANGEDILNNKKEQLKLEEKVDNVIYNYVIEDDISYNKVGAVLDIMKFDKDYHILELGIDKAYDMVNDKTNINVGIIDSPIYYSHEDMNIDKENIDFFASSHYETIDDVLSYYANYDHDSDTENKNNTHTFGVDCSYLGFRSHGTHVAGIIGAKHDNKGIDGVNDNVNLHYASCWYYGKNDSRDGRLINAGTAFSYTYALSSLIMSDCKIINMSISHGVSDENGKKIAFTDDNEKYIEYRDYYNKFFKEVEKTKKDFLIVKSAGNDGTNKEVDLITKIFKENEFANKHMIVVGAAKKQMPFDALENYIPTYKKEDYSNYGEYVDIFSLGTVYSTIYGNDYEWMKGTSQASPIISGIASLVLQANPNLNAEQVREILINSAKYYVSCEDRAVSLVNAENAIKNALEFNGEINKENENKIGLIKGTVKNNEDELVLKNVYIHFTNIETGETMVADVTEWHYECFLPFGTYNIEARTDGYVRYKKEGIKIDSTQPITHDIKINSNTEGGIKVGDFTLDYGTYKSDLPEGELNGGKYTINQDGTFQYENTWSNIQGEITTTKRTGTFEVKYSEGDEYDPTNAWVIIFKTVESNEKYPQETDAYDIKGNNKFSARQYPNNWLFTSNMKNTNTEKDLTSDGETYTELNKDRALTLAQENFGNWKGIKVDYEYVTTIKDRYNNLYHVINSYAHENYMNNGGEWLEEIDDGRFYAGTYYIRTSYTNNKVYVGHNPRDYGKYFENDTIGYFMSWDYIDVN